MVIREAWTKVAYTCDRAMYKEMQLTSEEMNNGVSELDALHNFAQRCSVKEIRKSPPSCHRTFKKAARS